MLLKSITLENFKGIREPVQIEFKPITLLFGPNSAGKSTILQALVYTREILERHNLDPDRTILGGEWMDLGGFRSLVHAHNLDEPIKIGFEINLSELGVPDYLSESEDYVLESWEHQRSPDEWLSNVQQASFSLSIRWSQRLNKPIIDKINIEINYRLLAEIESSLDGKNIAIQFLDIGHPIFATDMPVEDLFENQWFQEELLSGAFKSSHLATKELQFEDADIVVSRKESALHDISPTEEQLKIKEDIDNIFSASDLLEKIGHENEKNISLGYKNIGLIGQKDALPVRGSKLQLDSNIWTDSSDSYGPIVDHPLAAETLITSILSGLIVGPLDQACSELDKLLYIGPFREVPKRNYDVLKSPDLSRWARGLAAWDILMTEDNSLVDKVNAWLESEDKFDSQYRIETNNYKLIDMNGPLYRALKEDSYIAEDLLSGLLSTYLSEAPERCELKILSTDSAAKLEPADLGVGISQVIPVIVSALHTKRGIVSIEQPELHIHPAWQVVLGDLFATESKDRDIMFLIETHSEHLMLRLLRRIRETAEGERPPGAPELNPDDVAVIYVQNTENGTNLTSIKIDEDGEFIDRWPKGFFEERAEELF